MSSVPSQALRSSSATSRVAPSRCARSALRREQAFVVRCLTAVFIGSMFAQPILAPFLAYRFEGSNRLYVILQAAIFAPPLFLAAGRSLFGVRVRRRPTLLWIADYAVIAAVGWWCVAVILGVVNGNSPRYVVSDSFNFTIPMISYCAARSLVERRYRLRLIANVRKVLLWSLPFHFALTTYFTVRGVMVSAGLPIYILFCTWFLHETAARKRMSGVIAYLLSLLTVLASLKRTLYAGLVMHVLLYPILVNRFRLYLRVVLAVGVSAVVMFFVLTRVAPDTVNLDRITSRLESVESETGGFSHLQARQDEVEGIWNALSARQFGFVLGLGMGGTYEVHLGETAGAAEMLVVYDKHDSHFSPAGWVMRWGIVGALLYACFYCLLVFGTVRSVRRSTSTYERSLLAALTAYFLIAIALSLSSFSLTSNPLPHIIATLVVLHAYRDAVPARSVAGASTEADVAPR